jgi:hypothetical protein
MDLSANADVHVSCVDGGEFLVDCYSTAFMTVLHQRDMKAGREPTVSTEPTAVMEVITGESIIRGVIASSHLQLRVDRAPS